MKKFKFLFPLLGAVLLVSACGGTGGSQLTFDAAEFKSITVEYDGNEHVLGEVTGAPEGTDIAYSGREPRVEVGSYPATATLNKEGYKEKQLSATLTIKALQFTDAVFEPLNVTYDGRPHILGEVKGAPEGTNISYSGREQHTDVGSYPATATLTKEHYDMKQLPATLNILPAELVGLTYEGKTVKYDGADHINDVKLLGVLPDGSETKVTVKNADGKEVASAIALGTYYYTAVVTNKNYKTATFSATLIIRGEQTDMPVFAASDGTIYFANGLDHGYVYSLSSSNTLTRLDYSSPKEFNRASSSSALFISGSVWLNSVKEVKGGEASVLYSDSNIDDFVKYSDKVYYYSSNALTAAKSGIYKVDATVSDSEPVVTRVFEGKSDNLAIYNNSLYFTNGNDGNKLYKMSLPSSAPTLVLNEKVHEYVIEGGKLYCTVNGALNDYIGYIDLASGATAPTKLTNSAGEYLRVKGGYLYYHYTDLFGSVDPTKLGVWKLNISTKEETQLIASSQVNGFDLDASGNIVYTDANDLHLYRLNQTSMEKTDLLAGFVAPEVTPLNTGGRTIAYNNKVYFLNMYAGKTLYEYDESTGVSRQMTANKVADFYIYNGVLYFNQVTMLANNDVYSVDLKVSSEAVKLTSNDMRDMVSDGQYLYGVHYNWAGAAGGIARLKLDSEEEEYVKFSEVNGAKNLIIRDGKLYFIDCASLQDNGNINYYSLSDITPTSEKMTATNLSKNIKNVKQFLFDGDDIFYLYNGTIDNSVRRTSFSTLEAGVSIASSKTNPNEMILQGEYVYYYSFAETAQSSAGFYKVRKDATKDGSQEKILGYNSTYYGSGFAMVGSNLYFLNYIPKLTLGNAHTYRLNVQSGAVTKID